MYNPSESNGFYSESCYFRLSSNLFINIMQYPGSDLPYDTVPGVPRSNGKTFFGFNLYLARRYCKIPKVQGAPRNVNPAWAIPWLFGITIYCTFFNKDSLPPRQFFHEKRLSEKKSLRKCLLSKLLNLN